MACRRLPGKAGLAGRTFGQRWQGRLPPGGPAGAAVHRRGPDVPDQQDDGNVRHCLARADALVRRGRRTKAASKRRVMVDLPLRLPHHLQGPANHTGYAGRL